MQSRSREAYSVLGAVQKVRQSMRMITMNLEQARAVHSALREFFAAHPKGRLDSAALDDVQALCRAAESAVDDAECRRAIRSIENYSALLSVSEPTARGADFVRLRVQNALASFRSKLKAIEAGEPVALS
jgi:hypothetical protein